MRLKIELTSNQSAIYLPVGYGEYIQAIIYHLLDAVDSNWLHENGFTFEKRSFKLFCFSNILERGYFNKKNKLFTFHQQISFLLSSPIEWILRQIAKNSITRENSIIRFGLNELVLSSIEIIESKRIVDETIRVNALTPIETHSTLTTSDGLKKTYYYAPQEKEFSDLINKNLQKKWQALYNDQCSYNLSIDPVRIERCNEKIITFKGTVVKGWQCHFWLNGDPTFLQFALEVGLGGRNSQGFGMIELIENKL